MFSLYGVGFLLVGGLWNSEDCSIQPVLNHLGGNSGAFDNYENMNQLIRNSFLCFLWDWVRLYNGTGSMLLVDFMDWLGSVKSMVAVFFLFTCFLIVGFPCLLCIYLFFFFSTFLFYQYM